VRASLAPGLVGGLDVGDADATRRSGRHRRTPTPSASSVRCAPSVSTGC
jgi:hypothetical protein